MPTVTEEIAYRTEIVFTKTALSISIDEPSPQIVKHREALRSFGAQNFQASTCIDEKWFNDNIPCRGTCPAGTNARGYVMAIAEGRYQEAYLLARQNNPFVATCGKVCGAPCETACQRGKVDEPVSIRALKDFAVLQDKLSHEEVYSWIRKRMGKVTLGRDSDFSRRGKSSLNDVPRVAVVGAGPAGLTAAHDLALMGYSVCAYESGSNPGGMPEKSLPRYRLDREAVKKDVDTILSLDRIDLATDKKCGKDFTIDQLREEFDAVLIAVGLQKGRMLPIPGIEQEGVLSGLDFLMDVGTGHGLPMGKKAVIIGGGCVEVHGETLCKVVQGGKAIVMGGGCVATDVARALIRINKCKEVHLVCLEAAKGCRPDNPKEEMPAWVSDVVESIEEGIIFSTSWGPKRIIGENGKVKGLEVIKVKSVYDAQGRFNPIYIPGSERIIEASNILLSIGQAPDMSFMDGSSGFELDQRKMLKMDPLTLSTSKLGVFACGDILRPGLIINAVASGQLAAQSIHQYFGGTGTLGLAQPGPMESIPVPRRFERFLPRLKKERKLPALVPTKKRVKGWEAQECTYSESSAEGQAERCLNCNVSPVILPNANCILCGGCVDVCPPKCISMAYLQKADLDSTVDSKVDGYGPWAGLVHDEEKCIHCGLCSLRCPVDAISMIRFEEMLDVIGRKRC